MASSITQRAHHVSNTQTAKEDAHQTNTQHQSRSRIKNLALLVGVFVVLSCTVTYCISHISWDPTGFPSSWDATHPSKAPKEFLVHAAPLDNSIFIAAFANQSWDDPTTTSSEKVLPEPSLSSGDHSGRLRARGKRCNYLNSAPTVWPIRHFDPDLRRHVDTSNQTTLAALRDYRRRHHPPTPKWAGGASLYILGAMKQDPDSAVTLPLVLDNIRGMLQYWASYTMIVYADEASRVSLGSLQDPCLYFIPERFRHVSRTNRLAHARNLLMNRTRRFVTTKGENPKGVYVMMIDLDAANQYKFSFSIFADVMAENAQWDGVSFYRNYFYDIWALRYGDFDHDRLSVNGVSIVPTIQAAIQHDVIAAKRAFFPVNSSFNGMAIYKYVYTTSCDYIGGDLDNPMIEHCEHVAFHKCMIRKHGARIMIHNQSITNS